MCEQLNNKMFYSHYKMQSQCDHLIHVFQAHSGMFLKQEKAKQKYNGNVTKSLSP